MSINKETIVSGIRAALDDANLKYSFDEQNEVFQFSFKLDSKLSTTRVFIFARNSDYLIKAVSPIGGVVANSKMMTEIALLAVKINYGLVQGNFDLDFRDGELSFRIGVECTDLDELPIAFVNTTVAIGVKMWEVYGACFLGVIFNNLDSEEALKLKNE